MKNLVIISGVTVSFLIVILLFKLNKTKIEYDNKLLVLNRKVRDLTNLVDLSNTKKRLLNGEDTISNNQEQPNVNLEVSDANKTDNPIDTQYQNFVQNNGNFFDNLDNYEAPIPQEVKNDIDNLVNIENLDENELMAQMEALDVETSTVPNSEVSVTEEVNIITNVNEPDSLVNSEGDVLRDLVEDNEDNEDNENNNDISVDLEEVHEVSLDNVASSNIESVELENSAVNVQEEVIDINTEVNIDEVIDVNVQKIVDFQEVVNVDVEKVDDEPVVEEVTQNNNSPTVKFEDLEEMSVKSLQELCREYKLKIKGRKDELIARIKEYLSVDKL